jgi:hypothetical protein
MLVGTVSVFLLRTGVAVTDRPDIYPDVDGVEAAWRVGANKWALYWRRLAGKDPVAAWIPIPVPPRIPGAEPGYHRATEGGVLALSHLGPGAGWCATDPTRNPMLDDNGQVARWPTAAEAARAIETAMGLSAVPLPDTAVQGHRTLRPMPDTGVDPTIAVIDALTRITPP